MTRAGHRHLAFGAGTRLCLGAHLARLEIPVGVAGLLVGPYGATARQLDVVRARFLRRLVLG